MNRWSRIFCRMVQFCFHLALPVLPYREPEIHQNVADIVDLLKKNEMSRALLITDQGLKDCKSVTGLKKLLNDNGIYLSVYDKTSANPTVVNVEEARSLYIKEKCQCLIAFGGGSPMDCAKAVGARIAFPCKTVDQMRGLLKVWKKIPMLIAIPTTAGTGSEVTITAVITDSKIRYKYTMNNFTMIPRYAVLDPQVTYTLPAHLTATTGMDALTHAVEAYIGRSTSRQTRRLSLEATKLIFENIQVAYRDGDNRVARKNMLLAAHKAGIAFSKSYVGYIHAVAHSLGGQYNIPHGLANSVLMPVILEQYGSSAYKKLHQLGIAAGVANREDTDKVGAEKFIQAINDLNRKMNIPQSLGDIKKEDIPLMARRAAKEANPLYPVPKLMNAKELEQFYEKVADWR